MVVDDDWELTFILREILEAEGWETRSADDGQVGYLSFLLFKPDVVITDVYMPGKSGTEMMDHIRVHEPQTKTVYISADHKRLRSLWEEEAGKYPVAVLQKPFSRENLVNLLAQFCGK